MLKQIKIDFEKYVGKIKPFHAINNAPIMGTSTELFHYMMDAGIPYSRLHDTGGAYGMNRFVDIGNIFRDFDADPDIPESYDFAFTDWLLEEITKQGTKIFFRLGASIENAHKIKAYRIFPPKDNLKWAKICEGIIKHYNHGWANGYNYDIRYWEIWNEPDNEPIIEDNPMWKGTKEQYYNLYVTVSNYLKEKFPYIKIGGYSSCGFYALYEAAVAKEANVSTRKEYFIEFFQDFLKYISSLDTKAPLDFFSWHSYDTSKKNYSSSLYVREQLDKYGFDKTESILNEWNPGRTRRGTEVDACFISEMLCRLHKAPLDMLMYYDGQVNGAYEGLFNPIQFEIYPAYYAIHSFNELYLLENEAYSESDDDFPILAAVNDGIGKILIPNLSENATEINLSISERWEISNYRIIDGINGLVSQEIPTPLCIPTNKIVMIDCRKI